MSQQQKLDLWAERELEKLSVNVIVPIGDGNFAVFAKYLLETTPTGCVIKSMTRDPMEFSNRRIALSWCIADRAGRYDMAAHIYNLDQKKRNLTVDIECRKNLADRSRDSQFQEMVRFKLQTKIQSLHSIKCQLEKCINSTKYWQQRGFSNETARTGCSTAIKNHH
jgi:hypothetical protein